MKRPQRYLIRMILFLGFVITGCIVLLGPLREAFVANAPLNGMILGVLVIGVFFDIRQVLRLYPEADWLEAFQESAEPPGRLREPKLLAPMATMLAQRREGQLSLSTLSMRSLLDGIASRLDESRDISRYLIGLLIFLGLLGTFWGLLETVGSIRDVIASLPANVSDIGSVFGELKAGLESPLSGMGTAFSSSLFGLAGSLVLGFLDLQVGQAQNRFYNDLEDWLSGRTRLSSGVLPDTVGAEAVPVYVQALLEQTAESLENLQRTLAKGEEGRIEANSSINELVNRLGILTDQMRTEQTVLKRLAESHMEMKPILAQLAAATSSVADQDEQRSALDETTRGHIRNLDLYLGRLVEDLAQGREDIIQQLRIEIKLLARTIAALGR